MFIVEMVSITKRQNQGLTEEWAEKMWRFFFSVIRNKIIALARKQRKIEITIILLIRPVSARRILYAFSCSAIPRARGCVRTSAKEEVKLPRGPRKLTGKRELGGRRRGDSRGEGRGWGI